MGLAHLRRAWQVWRGQWASCASTTSRGATRASMLHSQGSSLSHGRTADHGAVDVQDEAPFVTVPGAPFHVRLEDGEAHTTSQFPPVSMPWSIEVLMRHPSFFVQVGQSSEAPGIDGHGLRHIESEATQRQQAIAAKVRFYLPTATKAFQASCVLTCDVCGCVGCRCCAGWCVGGSSGQCTGPSSPSPDTTSCTNDRGTYA